MIVIKYLERKLFNFGFGIQNGSIGFDDDHSLVEDKQGKRFELCVAL